MDTRDQALKKVEDEVIEKEEMQDQMISLAELNKNLEHLRAKAAVMSRQKDMDYVQKLETLIEQILNTVTDAVGDDPELLSESIKKLIVEGNMQEIKHLMVAMSIASDKREQLLGFDHTRQNDKKKKIQVMFKSSSGDQAGVSIEE